MAIVLAFVQVVTIVLIGGVVALSVIPVAYRLVNTCIWSCWKAQTPFGRSKTLFRFCAQHVESEASSDERFLVFFLSTLAASLCTIWLIASGGKAYPLLSLVVIAISVTSYVFLGCQTRSNSRWSSETPVLLGTSHLHSPDTLGRFALWTPETLLRAISISDNAGLRSQIVEALMTVYNSKTSELSLLLSLCYPPPKELVLLSETFPPSVVVPGPIFRLGSMEKEYLKQRNLDLHRVTPSILSWFKEHCDTPQYNMPEELAWVLSLSMDENTRTSCRKFLACRNHSVVSVVAHSLALAGDHAGFDIVFKNFIEILSSAPKILRHDEGKHPSHLPYTAIKTLARLGALALDVEEIELFFRAMHVSVVNDFCPSGRGYGCEGGQTTNTQRIDLSDGLNALETLCSVKSQPSSALLDILSKMNNATIILQCSLEEEGHQRSWEEKIMVDMEDRRRCAREELALRGPSEGGPAMLVNPDYDM